MTEVEMLRLFLLGFSTGVVFFSFVVWAILGK